MGSGHLWCYFLNLLRNIMNAHVQQQCTDALWLLLWTYWHLLAFKDGHLWALCQLTVGKNILFSKKHFKECNQIFNRGALEEYMIMMHAFNNSHHKHCTMWQIWQYARFGRLILTSSSFHTIVAYFHIYTLNEVYICLCTKVNKNNPKDWIKAHIKAVHVEISQNL